VVEVVVMGVVVALVCISSCPCEFALRGTGDRFRLT
jgi:hypothetical protein